MHTSWGLAARLDVKMQLMTSRMMRMKSANTCDSGGAMSTPAHARHSFSRLQKTGTYCLGFPGARSTS